jgi:hypothetical protein
MKVRNVLIFSILILFLLNFVSAQYFWRDYGGEWSPLWHIQSTGKGRFDVGIVNISITEGYSVTEQLSGTPFQPLVSPLYNVSETDIYEAFLIFPNNDYLQVYNQNLDLLQETLSGNSISQIDVLDFDKDGYSDNIVGIYEFNDTLVSFKSFTYNSSLNTINKTFEYNITTTPTKNITGVRCSSIGCYFTITQTNTTLYRVNNTGTFSLNLSFTGVPIEPIASYEMDGDGDYEFLIYSKEDILVFEEDGTIDYHDNPFDEIVSVRMFEADLTDIWRLVVLGRDSGSWDVEIKALKTSGLFKTIWTETFGGTYNPTCDLSGQLAIDTDYNGDNINDVYVVRSGEIGVSACERISFAVYDGKNGDVLSSLDLETPADAKSSLTIADMNNNGYLDFILSVGQRIYIYDPYSQTSILQDNISNNVYSCIPADINRDAFQEIICSGNGFTKLYSSIYENQNPTISEIAYDPDITIQANTTLYAYVTALDDESDTIYYRHRCSNDENWTTTDFSSTRSCSYSSLGIYTLTFGVRDGYHDDYTTTSQIIYVSLTGVEVCGDGECVGSETYQSCPADCPYEEEIPDTTTSEGGIPIPTQLVDTENINQGLLPEIYYGTLAFWSKILNPLIIVVFVIFMVLIMLTIGTIIKKIANKVNG